MKIASLVLICFVALAFVSGYIMTAFADPVDPPTPLGGGNGRPHKSIRTMTLEGNGTTPLGGGNGRPHK